MTHDLGSLTAIVAFLVAMMVLARACADEGLFEVLGGHIARWSRGSSQRLLAWAVGVAAVVTATLSLDATVVLLTPVLLAASARRSSAYASVRLANSGSTLLPVSNLTNLLVFGSTGLSFLGFAWAMLPVWLVAVAAEYVILRVWFAAELRVPSPAVSDDDELPLFPLAVVVVVLLALAGGTAPWIPATAGAILVGTYALVRRRTTWRDLLAAANLPFAALILLWAFVVSWLGSTSVGSWFDDAMPSGTDLGSLLLIAVLAMIAANVVNNLPATLLLLPAAEVAGPVAVLALLIGVNVGANLTYIGSVANLLWRQAGGRAVSSAREFHLLGVLTTPPLVLLCTVVLWGWTSLIW
ncbi:SLC13 family permease [Aeromicrobium chenweiae]|uniref:Arsenic transporter n=1 Tax=Aeromicrobium chenweiae TaxID=2079793 RepID=A0A2S0WKS0_9ACTN|nr:SLC13 family permease [Aeromicrobium chenweiae]AWB91874.1 arsenic transporter [Aeromicrobium chenweiae]TGN32722.1 arsenic transporter [Aeromicrobium chenweiae]